MAAAIARSLYKNYTTVRNAAKDAGVTHGYVNQAAIVLEHARDLAVVVLAGMKPLNEAYEEAAMSS
jgi:prolyl-tRNA editing enzyme YbaK/EbsC (Cys-tRNA(Pro) deacylase)